MPTVLRRELLSPLGGTGLLPGPPYDVWRIDAHRNPPRQIGPLYPNVSTDVYLSNTAYILGRTSQPVPLGPQVPFTEGVSISPAVMGTGSGFQDIHITYPDGEEFEGASVYAIQAIKSPINPASGALYDTGVYVIRNAPGPFTRSGNTLNFTSIAFFGRNYYDPDPDLHWEWDFDGTIVSVASVETMTVVEKRFKSEVLSRTFPPAATPGGPIRMRAIVAGVQPSVWCIVKLAPFAEAVASVIKEDKVLLDGSNSFDPDGTVVEWQWTIDTFSTDGPISLVSTEALTTIDPIEMERTWQDGRIVHCELRVKDNDGYLSNGFAFSFKYSVQTEGIFGSFVDRNGVLFSAIPEGNSVVVSRFPNGVASRQILKTIPGAKNPRLKLDRERNSQYLSYRDMADNTRKILRSTDGGKEFS